MECRAPKGNEVSELEFVHGVSVARFACSSCGGGDFVNCALLDGRDSFMEFFDDGANDGVALCCIGGVRMRIEYGSCGAGIGCCCWNKLGALR